MTDLSSPPVDWPAGARADGEDRDPARYFLAALLAGAAAIHLAMTPSHLGESALEGAGFLAAGWVQLGLALAVVLRPSRWVLRSIVGVNLVLIAVWLVSRTAGLPFGAHSGHPESVSIVDGACVVAEGLAVVLSGFLLVNPASALARSRAVALVGALGALILTSAAVASPSARDHAAGSHGDHGHAGEETAGGAHGHTDGHGAGKAADDLGFSALQNGQMGHDHGPGGATTDEEIDPATAAVLAQQLALTAPLVEKYPTLGAAKAAGWWQAGPFAPGLGVHYSSPGYGMNGDGDMDPEDIANPMLIFDGIEEDSALAGFMYMAYQDTEPEGFAGPLDKWHYHTTVCIVNTPEGIRTPFGADLKGVTEEMCAAEGGSFIDFTGYMVHVWTVPGYESPLGTFSDLNPKIKCPDGTYYTIPIRETGLVSSTCKNL